MQIQKISDWLDDKQARDIKIIKLNSSLADYMVIATAKSRTHLQALANGLANELKQQKEECLLNSHTDSSWLIVDTFSIIVHLFLEETRKIYNLEDLWSFV